MRTLSEEVFGEFDYKVKYPYRDNNKFLIRYSNTLSQLLDSVDELISTCFQLNDSGWDMCYKCKRQTMRQSLKSTPPIIGDVASCIRPEDYLTMA